MDHPARDTAGRTAPFEDRRGELNPFVTKRSVVAIVGKDSNSGFRRFRCRPPVKGGEYTPFRKKPASRPGSRGGRPCSDREPRPSESFLSRPDRVRIQCKTTLKSPVRAAGNRNG